MSNWFPQQHNSVLKASVFLVFPAIFLFFALPFNRTHFGNDPEYAYLMNGINIGMLKPVGHTDNPGTTVQLYSAIFLRVAYLLQPEKSEGFQKYVLRNADEYIELERQGLIWINSLVILVLGVISWLLLRNIWLSLLLQVMPFTSANLTEHVFTKVSPEPVLLLASAAMVILVLHFLFRKKKEESKFAIYYAMVCGFGLATKATFLPLVLIPFLLLDGKALRKRFLLYFFPFFLLFTIPAIPQYPHMAKWFLGLTAHTGTYGEGGWGIINPIQYFYDLVTICISNPVLFVTILVSALILISTMIRSAFRDEFKNNLIFRILTALTAAQLAGIFMVAKHYHANHYLIPELCLMATSWIFIFFNLKEKLSGRFRKVFSFVPVLLILISAGIVLQNRNYLQAANEGYKRSNIDYEKMMQFLEKDYKGYTCTYFYPTSINPYSALRWGNVYSKFNHLDALKHLYPEGYFFDIRTNNFSLWETPVDSHTLATIAGNKILLLGGPFENSYLEKMQQSGVKLTLVYKGYLQIVYTVEVPGKASN
jgi:hypothetical protein